MEPDTEPRCVIQMNGIAPPIYVESYSYEDVIKILTSRNPPEVFEVEDRDGRRQTIMVAHITVVSELLPADA